MKSGFKLFSSENIVSNLIFEKYSELFLKVILSRLNIRIESK